MDAFGVGGFAAETQSSQRNIYEQASVPSAPLWFFLTRQARRTRTFHPQPASAGKTLSNLTLVRGSAIMPSTTSRQR